MKLHEHDVDIKCGPGCPIYRRVTVEFSVNDDPWLLHKETSFQVTFKQYVNSFIDKNSWAVGKTYLLQHVIEYAPDKKQCILTYGDDVGDVIEFRIRSGY